MNNLGAIFFLALASAVIGMLTGLYVSEKEMDSGMITRKDSVYIIKKITPTQECNTKLNSKE